MAAPDAVTALKKVSLFSSLEDSQISTVAQEANKRSFADGELIVKQGDTGAAGFWVILDGTVEVRASRYVGVWEEYATYTATLSDGQAEFLLPAVGYVSGTSGAGGAGSAQLEVAVADTSDHEEKTTKLLKIVESTIQHQLISSSSQSYG